jgi:L-2,4-diaminobutyric acid acetyltransferase
MDSPDSDTVERRPPASLELRFRPPTVTDGCAVHELIARCPPLDRNSLYLNLLQCTHFAQTCVIAESANSDDCPRDPLCGFVSGYLIPNDPGRLFIWQVAVAPHARGRGLATRMLNELLSRPVCAATTHLQTTITPSNRASWALFRAFAQARHAHFEERVLFDRDLHFDGAHESEHMVTIGPFAPHSFIRGLERG